jgi:hypothetical protein
VGISRNLAYMWQQRGKQQINPGPSANNRGTERNPGFRSATRRDATPQTGFLFWHSDLNHSLTHSSTTISINGNSSVTLSVEDLQPTWGNRRLLRAYIKTRISWKQPRSPTGWLVNGQQSPSSSENSPRLSLRVGSQA